MYFRKVVSKKKSGYTHTTVQLVESYRNEEGKSRTKNSLSCRSFA